MLVELKNPLKEAICVITDHIHSNEPVTTTTTSKILVMEFTFILVGGFLLKLNIFRKGWVLYYFSGFSICEYLSNLEIYYLP